MKLLLTGASGFVGRGILEALTDDDVEVCAVSRSGREARDEGKARWLACDLLEAHAAEALIDEVHPQILVHAAWHTRASYWDDPENDDWLRASEQLLEAFIAAGGRRFIAVGSCAEYATQSEPCHELRTPLSEASRYGAAKAALCRRLEAEHRAGRIESAHARLFFLYGPGEKPSRLVPSLIAQLQAGEPAQTGPGERVRDFMHVRDAGCALARLALSDLNGPINIASGKATRIADIATCLGELASRPDLVRIGALPGRTDEPESIVADITRQTIELGFRPVTPLRTGLEELFFAGSRIHQPRRDCARHSAVTDSLHHQPD